MMSHVNVFLGFWTLILLVIVLYGWRRYLLEAYREALFVRRDELYALAFQRAVKFDDSEYRDMEHRLNTRIRYAHLIRFWTLMPLVISSMLAGRADELRQYHPEEPKLRAIAERASKDLAFYVLVAHPHLLLLIAIGAARQLSQESVAADVDHATTGAVQLMPAFGMGHEGAGSAEGVGFNGKRRVAGSRR